MQTRGPIKWAVALAGGLFATSAVAANVPMFRFALERWPPENYQAVVFHRGPLESEEKEWVDTLQLASSGLGANVTVATVDVADPMEEPMQSMWTSQTNALSPWLVVRAPKSEPDSSPVWAGPLRADTPGAVLDSPARRKIVEGLLRGDSAVWVLLECGDAVRDEAAVDVLSEALKELEGQLRLPPPGPEDPSLQSALPLRVAFSLVRVTRNDPAEGFFVNQLVHGELLSEKKPAVFPVFGRGRALAPLVGRDLDPRSIQKVCALLAGACSREEKDSIPGKDLLLAGDWNSIFKKPAPVPSRPAPAFPTNPVASVPDQKPALADGSRPAQVPAASGASSRAGPAAWALTGCLVLTIGWLAWRFRHKPR